MPTPLRALLHPAWAAALLVLVLNDHVLKQAGVLPGVLTGKLSDLAGLIVVPAVIALAARVRTRRGLALAHLATGAGFAAINVWPALARGVEVVTAFTPFPWVITVDPTDLLALPALWVSWRVLGAAMARPAEPPLWLARAAFGAGALACMATSPPPPEPFVEPPFFPPVTGAVALANDTGASLVLRVRPLADDVWLDCAAVAGAPDATLTRELFAAPELWRVESGRAMPLGGASLGGGCAAWLVDGSGLPPALVFVDLAQRPPTSLPSTVDEARPERTVFIVGGELGWAAHPVLFDAPGSAGAVAPAGCAAADDPEAAPDWSTPPPDGWWRLEDDRVSPDGCHALDLRSGPSTWRMYLCLPGVDLPLSVGDDVRVTRLSLGHGFLPVDGVELATERALVRVGRGEDLVPMPSTWRLAGQPGCPAYHLACGGLVVPLAARPAGASGDGADALRPGRSAPVGDRGRLSLGRAFDLVVGRDACLPESVATAARYVESIYIETEE